MKVARLYRFHGSHSLPGVPGYDKPHEHDYTVEVMADEADGPNPDYEGMVIDTQVLDDIAAKVIHPLDSTDLNEHFQPSTVEEIAERLRNEFIDRVYGVGQITVTVWEDNDRWGQAP